MRTAIIISVALAGVAVLVVVLGRTPPRVVPDLTNRAVPAQQSMNEEPKKRLLSEGSREARETDLSPPGGTHAGASASGPGPGRGSGRWAFQGPQTGALDALDDGWVEVSETVRGRPGDEAFEAALESFLRESDNQIIDEQLMAPELQEVPAATEGGQATGSPTLEPEVVVGNLRGRPGDEAFEAELSAFLEALDLQALESQPATEDPSLIEY